LVEKTFDVRHLDSPYLSCPDYMRFEQTKDALMGIPAVQNWVRVPPEEARRRRWDSIEK
jgi:hypothetical protein